MGCKITTRCDEDGNKVNVILNDDLTVSRVLANDMSQEWTGTPSTLKPCDCEPQTYTCTAQSESAETFGGQPNHVLQQRELLRGQLGEALPAAFIAADDIDILPGDNPITIQIPAHAANSVLALHMAYGGEDRGTAPGTNTIEDPTITISGSDVNNLTAVWETEADDIIPDQGGFVYYMNGVTGNAGSSITVDFAKWDIPASGNKPGVVQWVLKEYTSDQPALTVSDFDLANAVAVTVDDSNGTPDVSNPPQRTHSPVDLGACDGVFYGIARHVAHVNSDGTPFYDTNWSEMTTGGSGYEELYDIGSVDYDQACQLGVTSGLIRGGNGPTAYSYQQNYHWSQFSGFPLSTGVYVPTVHSVAQDDDQFEEMCTVTAVNQCDDKEVTVSCRLQASVDVTVAAGNTATITPFINGVAITAAAQTVSTAGTSTVTIDATAAGANIAAGGPSTDHDFYLELSGIGAATSNEWSATCTTSPV